jgi:hypothetical protein
MAGGPKPRLPADSPAAKGFFIFFFFLSRKSVSDAASIKNCCGIIWPLEDAQQVFFSVGDP